MKIVITGGAGFIGSSLVRYIIEHSGYQVINIDKLTYAGHLESLSSVRNHNRYRFRQVDITNKQDLHEIFRVEKPDAVIHLAAESHVDRSIDSSADFIKTNILGTYTLLEASRAYWQEANSNKRKNFRFIHVSTDEVYGELGETGYFSETTPYQPHSPYSASKASSDHLARAWHDTYQLPTLISNCSNNYGPYQFPEKLIPVVILKALQNQSVPVYGDGKNVRDWLYVTDHVRALLTILQKGKPGKTYNVGGNNEKQNIQIVETICEILDGIQPRKDGKSYKDQITFVKDRPGHDRRYAIDASKIENQLGWKPRETFETGIHKTIRWYLGNIDWCEAVTENNYDLKRLGILDK